MSLNKEQGCTAAEELQAHFKTSTLSAQMIAEKLNVTTEDVEKVLTTTAPLGVFSHRLQRFVHLVWDVRGITDGNTKGNGRTPESYTYLKDEEKDYWSLR